MVGATGYGVALDDILVIVVQLNSNFVINCACRQIQSSNQIVNNETIGPDFHLEDKVDIQTAGIDRLPPTSSILEGLRST